MPGTILVSVLEFMDLPLSSSTSIRVSMGKIEYQINDKGNFSFPLTSLRDDLIVKIHDADGNETSRTGVHIRLILEKGVWDDIFPLGDGRLHLKLQFILNDEERDRIRAMRQSALKKKHDELLSSGRRGVESDRSSASTSSAESPSRANDEVSESPKKCMQHEAVSQLHGPVSFVDNRESSARNVLGAQLDQKQLIKPDKMAIKLTNSEQNDVMNDSLAPTIHSEKKSAAQRTPSNVRKMISAFESGRAQDMRPNIKPPPIKFQPSKTGTKDSSETHQQLEQAEGVVREMEESSSQQKDSNARNELDKYYSLESSGVWIFPDESRKVCVTASGKSVMDKKKKIKENEESKTSSRDDNGDANSGGPFNQVIKVAIVIGFGVLVLLTRQRKIR